MISVSIFLDNKFVEQILVQSLVASKKLIVSSLEDFWVVWRLFAVNSFSKFMIDEIVSKVEIEYS